MVITTYKLKLSSICLLIIMLCLSGCSNESAVDKESDREPNINPDYSGITIPPNIVPLNFLIDEEGKKYEVKLYSTTSKGFRIKSKGNRISIPSGKWKQLISQSIGNEFFIEIKAKQEGGWTRFKRIINSVSTDPINSYLVYRLIEPGFEMWGSMGIYQRSLEDFKEYPVMINAMSEHNCMNCHSFAGNNSNNMLFHMRGKLGGTFIYRNGVLTKVDTKTDQTISAGVYPAWHPDGRLAAFSVNKIMQSFHAIPDRKVEVIDTVSDLIIYDTELNVVNTCASISLKDRYETFPSWSPDGRFLYYCSARALPQDKYDQIRYDLLRIAFNTGTREFGTVDTIVSSTQTGLSVSFPRISPDRKYVMFCMSDYGNFTIWHKESDLYLLNLETREITKPDINSDQTESYHTWSSDGRWIVFSSRRIDGLFTRLYFTYFDTDGKAHKPFILPQKNPQFYDTFLKSYNVPELVTGRVELNPRIISESALSEPLKASFGPGN